MIDTHAHLDSNHFDNDRNDVIKNSFESGLEYIIIPAVEPDGFDNLLKLMDVDNRLRCAIGVHPHSANSVDKYILKRVDELASNEKVVAIGEIGLDYYYDFATPDSQKYALIEQIYLAKNHNLPIIVHNRESDEDLLKILENEQDGNLNIVLHCFSSTTDVLKRAMDCGCNVSFTGNITFKKTTLDEQVSLVPLDKIMIETDAPYMTPVPFRGHRNVPINVKYVAQKISEIKNIQLEEVITMTTKNAKKFFSLITILFFLLLPISSISQENDDIYYEEEEYVNPYKKFLGIGFTLGMNTVVDRYEPIRYSKSISQPVILNYGGVLTYELLDFLTFSGSYTFSKDTKNAEEFDVEPTIYNQLEITSNWIANPHGRVNFYAMFGFSLLINKYGKSIGQGWETFTRSGINTGIGVYINIPIESAGMFVIAGEMKLNFQLGSVESSWDPSRRPVLDPTVYEPTNISTFFSIPRVNILWFPTFLFDN